jgi:hypothetical protein
LPRAGAGGALLAYELEKLVLALRQHSREQPRQHELAARGGGGAGREGGGGLRRGGGVARVSWQSAADPLGWGESMTLGSRFWKSLSLVWTLVMFKGENPRY